MPKASQAKAAIPYIERLLEDAFVQEQVRSAVGGLRAAYSRARKQRTQVVEDKGLYRNLRQAATALQRATRALQPPEPEPEPKHRGRKFAAVALAIGATAFVTMKLQKEYSQQRENSAVVASAVDTASAPGGPRPESPAQEPTPAVNAAEDPNRVSAPGS